MDRYQENIGELTSEVAKLKSEKYKLNSDVVDLKNSQSQVDHIVQHLERKNQSLIQENLTLKDILYGQPA